MLDSRLYKKLIISNAISKFRRFYSPKHSISISCRSDWEEVLQCHLPFGQTDFTSKTMEKWEIVLFRTKKTHREQIQTKNIIISETLLIFLSIECISLRDLFSHLNIVFLCQERPQGRGRWQTLANWGNQNL